MPFLSLTELGGIYGVSRNKVGQWSVEHGLRTSDKKPSQAAFDGGFVEQRLSTQPGTYYWVWDAEKTIRLLDDHKQQSPPLGDGRLLRGLEKLLDKDIYTRGLENSSQIP